MNTLETAVVTDPYNKSSECGLFIIDDASIPFALNDVMVVGQQYTFSLWLMSETDAAMSVYGNQFLSNSVWKKYFITFTASSTDLLLRFDIPGMYYIYHPQLEIGNKPTDWTPAPEDLDPSEELDETNARMQSIYETVAQLSVGSNEIKASVESTEKTISDLNGDIEAVRNEVASIKLESDSLKLDFQNIADNGVNKIVTETGFTFDRDGMLVDNTDSPTKTQITPDGMTVYKKDAAGGSEEVLEASSDGVNATNLHAKTYLIIGGRSRFENYGTNRTGCFWIGG